MLRWLMREMIERTVRRILRRALPPRYHMLAEVAVTVAVLCL